MRRLLESIRRAPWSIVAVWLLLTAAGWLAIARCETFAEGSGRFIRLQMIWTALSAVGMLLAATPRPRTLYRWSYALFGVALLLLVWVYAFEPINGARRWIRIGGLGFQPSELAKSATVLVLARYLAYRENYRRWWGLLWPVGIVLAPTLLILREPDLGTALLFLPLVVAMVFVAGARRVDLLRLALIGLLVTPVLWSQMSREQRARVTSLFHQAGPGETARDEAYQLRQAKRMLALGDGWGSLVQGTYHDDPAVYHLPEARCDFIFCVLGERLGIPGLIAVLALYGYLVSKALALAAASDDPFSRLVAVGIATMIGLQVLINTSMNVGLLPITGLSLPLVSYGGSGLLTQSLGVGMLLRIEMSRPLEIGDEPFRYAVE